MKINLIANLNGALMGLSFGPEADVVVGREIGCSIAPLTADGLSRRHARLYFKDGAWHVEDLSSTNGTFRNGKKLEAPEQVAAKDKLHFGRFELTVDEIAGLPQAEPEQSAPVADVPPVAPVAELKPLEPAPAAESKPLEPAPVAEVKPLESAPAAKAGATRPLPPVIRKPVLGGGLKPGLKLPGKPGLPGGLKLPGKPGMPSGLKLPPKPGLSAGLKLPPKTPAASAKSPLAPAAPLEPVAELTPVEPLTPIE